MTQLEKLLLGSLERMVQSHSDMIKAGALAVCDPVSQEEAKASLINAMHSIQSAMLSEKSK